MRDRRPDALIGSSAYSGMVKTGAGEIQLGDIVRAAFVTSGLAPEAWNALPDAERDAMLAAEITTREMVARETGGGSAGAVHPSDEETPM